MIDHTHGDSTHWWVVAFAYICSNDVPLKTDCNAAITLWLVLQVTDSILMQVVYMQLAKIKYLKAILFAACRNYYKLSWDNVNIETREHDGVTKLHVEQQMMKWNASPKQHHPSINIYLNYE